MKTVKFQLIHHKDKTPLSEVFEREIIEDEEYLYPNVIPLRQSEESVIRIADIVMQPRRLYINEGATDMLAFGVPEDGGWSNASYFEAIIIIDK